MRALLPRPAEDVDLAEAYAIPTGDGDGDRSMFVRCNMISTLDGAIALKGRSGKLGGPVDRRLFKVLRSLTDVILVGAGTVRAEGYGPARLDDELRRQRLERGQSAVPPIAVVTRSGDLDWSSPFFTEAEERPIVFVTEDGRGAMGDLADEVADIVVAGQARVDAAQAIDHLGAAGHRSVLLEGGPGLNAEVVRTGRLHELCLTLAPRLAAGEGARVLAGPELPDPLELDVVHLLEEDGFLFSRLAVRRSSGSA